MTNNPTTAEGLSRAREVFRGDWDQHGVTVVYLPRAVAEKLLADRGWVRMDAIRGPGPWLSPSREQVWDTDDAVALALAAETLDQRSVADEHVDDLDADDRPDLKTDPPRSSER